MSRETFKMGNQKGQPMAREDVACAILILFLFVLAAIILVLETRSLWAKETLIYQGNLTSYARSEGNHSFTFDGNHTITETGWLWKTHPPLNRMVSLYRRGNALVLKEVTEPVIA